MASHEFSSSVPPTCRHGHWNTNPPSRKLITRFFSSALKLPQAAILTRREILMQSPDGFAERQETKLALTKLRNLKKEVLKFL